MGLAHRLFAPVESREKSADLANPPRWLVNFFASGSTASGRRVSPGEAEQFSAVFRAVELISVTIATVPLHVYRLREGRGKDPARDHPLYALLHDRPNRWMTSAQWRKLMHRWVELWGNAYNRIVLDGRGRVIELLPLHPSRVRVKEVKELGTIVYEHHPADGPMEVLLWDEVHHRMGPTQNGLEGMSRVSLARESIGLGLTMEEFAGRLFANQARPSGIFTLPTRFKNDAERQEFKKRWQDEWGGTANAGKTLIVDGIGEGEWKQIGMNSQDAEFLASRKFGITEIARWFGLPPHKLADLERATFSNIADESQSFVTDAIRPRCVEAEQEMERDLLSEAERWTHTIKHALNGLMRGNIQQRGQWYALARQWGVLSANDIRELEDENPIGPEGDIYLSPLNMTDSGALLLEPVPPAEEAPGEPGGRPMFDSGEPARQARTRYATETRLRLRAVHRRLMEDTAARLWRKEVGIIRGAARKLDGKQGFAECHTMLSEFYELDRHDGISDYLAYARRVFQPVLLTFADAVLLELAGELGLPELQAEDFVRQIDSYLSRLVHDQAKTSLDILSSLLTQTGGEAAAIAEWIEASAAGRTTGIAVRECVRFESALVRLVCARENVAVIWRRSRAGDCASCAALEGRRAAPGELFQANPPIRHPPAHEGCTCILEIG
jgi:HK97 family phage portal protein